MDPNDKQLCKCGHDLAMHASRGCTAGNSRGRQCWYSQTPNGVIALFEAPKPEPVSLQSVQEHHQPEQEEQIHILCERRTKSGGKNS